MMCLPLLSVAVCLFVLPLHIVTATYPQPLNPQYWVQPQPDQQPQPQPDPTYGYKGYQIESQRYGYYYGPQRGLPAGGDGGAGGGRVAGRRFEGTAAGGRGAGGRGAGGRGAGGRFGPGAPGGRFQTGVAGTGVRGGQVAGGRFRARVAGGRFGGRVDTNRDDARMSVQGGQRGAGSRRFQVVPNPADAVAASAVRRSSQYFYKPGPVLFDQVITNIGGAYNNKYGIFTAPVPGIYLVKYHAVSQPEGIKPVLLDLYRNKEIINCATGKGNKISVSNSAVLFLYRGDTISVQGRAGSAIFGQENGAYSSFSVVLVKMGLFTDSKEPTFVKGW